MSPAVDLIINCYERTYREVMRPGFVAGVEAQARLRFARRVLVLNNVDDPPAALRRARRRLADGEVDEVVEVAAGLPRALRALRLRPRDLGRIPHFSDWAYVTVTRPGSPWLLHWDPEVTMVEGGEWIPAAIERMEADPRLLVANPTWAPGAAEREAVERSGHYAIGYGFSDQVFLARRQELARPIYRDRARASLRYPLAHIALTFEARVDAHMRCRGRLRLTDTSVLFAHRGCPGAAHPRARRWERWRRRWHRALLAHTCRPDAADPRRRI